MSGHQSGRYFCCFPPRQPSELCTTTTDSRLFTAHRQRTSRLSTIIRNFTTKSMVGTNVKRTTITQHESMPQNAKTRFSKQQDPIYRRNLHHSTANKKWMISKLFSFTIFPENNAINSWTITLACNSSCFEILYWTNMDLPT